MERISTQQAAARKSCTSRCIRYALKNGRLNGEQIGKVRVVWVDKVFAAWAPNEKMQIAKRKVMVAS